MVDTDPHLSFHDETNISLEVYDGEDHFNPRKDKEFKSFTASWSCVFDQPAHIKDLRKVFGIVIKKQELEVIEQSKLECLVISRRSLSFRDIFHRLLPCVGMSKTTSFRFRCRVLEQNLIQSCEFKGLTGSPKEVQRCFDYYKKQLEKNHIYGLTDLKRTFEPIIYSKKGYKKGPQEYHNLMTERSILDIREKGGELEGNKIVEINRLLSSDQYSVGKKVAKFKVDFIENLKNCDKEKQLREEMVKLNNFSHEVHQTLTQEGNLGGDNMKDWLPMAHFAVEKYIYENVYFEFFSKFKEFYGEKDKKFSLQVKLLREKTSTQLLNNLKVESKFRIKDEEEHEKLYQDAIIELEKLDLNLIPKDKLDCLIMMNSRMRSNVIKHHKAKVEIESMDDELPITIYILSRCSSKHIFSNIEFIDTYIKCSDDLDNEERILCTVNAAASYIAGETWNIEEIE